MNTAQYNPTATSVHAAHAISDPQMAPTFGMATAAITQHPAMPTPPTTIPITSCRARPTSSTANVTARLASATEGAAENSPENAFGLTTSPTRARTTTNTPPA